MVFHAFSSIVNQTTLSFEMVSTIIVIELLRKERLDDLRILPCINAITKYRTPGSEHPGRIPRCGNNKISIYGYNIPGTGHAGKAAQKGTQGRYHSI